MNGYRHEAVAAVLRVALAPGVTQTPGAAHLQVLAVRRTRAPFAGEWALPSGALADDETLDESVARHLAAKVHLTELAHLEQLATRSAPHRDPAQRTVATAYLGLVPSDVDLPLPADAAWCDIASSPRLAFDHDAIVSAAVERMRAKLSYTNIGFALAPPSFTIAQLRAIYVAALGYDVAPTNLQRVLTRRGQLAPTGELAATAEAGGRPPRLFAFTHHQVVVTDPFAALRPSAAG